MQEANHTLRVVDEREFSWRDNSKLTSLSDFPPLLSFSATLDPLFVLLLSTLLLFSPAL